MAIDVSDFDRAVDSSIIRVRTSDPVDAAAVERTIKDLTEAAQIAKDLLACLPESEHRQSLELLTEVAVARVS